MTYAEIASWSVIGIMALFSIACLLMVLWKILCVTFKPEAERQKDWMKEQRRRRKSAGLDPVD